MKRKQLYIAAICFLASTRLTAQSPKEIPIPLIPRPVDYRQGEGAFPINAATAIYYAQDILRPAAELLKDYLHIHKIQPILTWGKQTEGGTHGISLQMDSLTVPQPEGYHLQISKEHIELIGHDMAGIIHGIQSLRQLAQSSAGKGLVVPGGSITDYPRFAYRSMALDVSRHLFPIAFIKKYIDLLSLYKFNTFHWHLTDDQGWRIEIKQYPRLQSEAAWRKQTLIGHKKETPHRFDGIPYGGYYTQEEIKEVVRYATQRGITIIPEIEMPGHALAALKAYPALGCTGGPYETATFWGVFDDVFCAGNDSTFVFLQQVLDEVMQLFPSHYIHIGGDECPKTRWNVCPKCQQRMKAHALKDEHDLQSYFIQRIEKYLNSKGRDIIGWDEILEGGLAPNATVMSWRGEEGGIAAAQQKHRVIMTPESHVYFDYYLSRNKAEPVAAGHYTPLNKVYSYQPAFSLPDSLQSYIAGVEGQAWSEYLVDERQGGLYDLSPRHSPGRTGLDTCCLTQLRSFPAKAPAAGRLIKTAGSALGRQL
ncbi:beta-N-acetylhexosaminidase [Paraflavitalea soli]|uniref:beta-N-acetylhexosaminidase n=1 Tax=Paraflavitalea soli TaxID=2315862 RepID=UPI001FE68D1D|nr:beta-N-acetylhexosaminidase [Paraflavitalea soli]